jgi:hypothetical protein
MSLPSPACASGIFLIEWRTYDNRGCQFHGIHSIAERHDLQIVGERARVDLELATGRYRGRNLNEKGHAGFSLYAHADDLSKLRRVLDQRELTEILSL